MAATLLDRLRAQRNRLPLPPVNREEDASQNTEELECDLCLPSCEFSHCQPLLLWDCLPAIQFTARVRIFRVLDTPFRMVLGMFSMRYTTTIS